MVAIAYRFGAGLRELGRAAVRHEVTTRAAAAAYYCLFSLFPLALFIAPLLALVAGDQARIDVLLARVRDAVPGNAYTLIMSVVDRVVYGRGTAGAVSIGAILAMWSASSIFSALRDALNHTVGIKETRPWWRHRLVALAFVLGASIFGIAATIILIDGQSIVRAIGGHFGLDAVLLTIWTIVQYVVAIALVVGLAWTLYYFLPDAYFSAREALASAVVATLLWLVLTLLFRLYVQHFGSYNRVYGSIGAVIVLLTWMYLSMLAVLIAGEIGAILHTGMRRVDPARGAAQKRISNRGPGRVDAKAQQPSAH